MSKDTINPTQNNNMEYTESEKHCIAIIEKALPDNGSPRGLATTILNNIKAKGYEISNVRVPSSPVMSFEEFKEYCKNIAGIEPEPIVKKRYEGYLIGTRSETDNFNTILSALVWYSKQGDEYRERTLLADAVKDFLRSQINK